MRAPEFWHRHDFISQLKALALSPLGWLYNATVEWKRVHAQPYQASAKVVCVGNLSVGGTGKTPVAIAIAEMIAARGKKVCFLSRGYGGKTRGPARVTTSSPVADVGDEPLLLARAAPVIVAQDRGEGARLADADKADVIVMDDGHQNFTLAKNLSFVVVDAASGFGNGYVLPAGPLRESIRHGLKRATALIVVGEDPFPKMKLPVFRARLTTPKMPELDGKRVLAFAGIGRPEKFFDTLPGLGMEVAETRGFDDHHVYTPSEIARLKARAASLNALLVTTEKDYVRLTEAERAGIIAVPVKAVFDDAAGIAALLDRL